MNSHLTIGERWRVISLRLDQGFGFRDIARRMHCTYQTVRNILQLFHETNDVVELEGRGVGNSYPQETATQLSNRFYRRTGRFVTPQTIRNYRRRWGFRAVHTRIQPLLTQRHAAQRLAFCQQYIYDDWRRVIFADEKIFEVDATGIVYWIPYGRPRPTTFRSQVQYQVAVFGAVWYNNKSNLVFIQGRTNTSTFVEYLEDGLHSHRRLIRNYYFIHDRPTWAHTVTAH
ncbi:unnamed protein product [Rotaria sordida]|uniref:Transposase Tc1-like domain-containing protein n=2 Tax=Rotaria sordida TaxID=392033 RepID=A0A814KMT8_9BILA|nr:unnamed protein product [Rotaria sordida]